MTYDQIWVKELLDVIQFVSEYPTLTTNETATALKIDVIALCIDKIKKGA